MPGRDHATIRAANARLGTTPTARAVADAQTAVGGGEAALVIEGECVALLRRSGTRFIMIGRGDVHTLSADATDRVRLAVTWHNFCWMLRERVASETAAWKALITPEQRSRMRLNGARGITGAALDPVPVVALFTPDADATWVLSELDPVEPDLAFGLCDLGLGFPELGRVTLTQIASVRGRFGLKVERDAHFRPDKPLSRYAEEACAAGRIRL